MSIGSGITIIIVTFNAAKLLEATITSVIKLDNIISELIIIDGASTDETVTIIKKYSVNINIWISEADSGIYNAMNKGWNLANPDNYILYLGAGDKIISLPDKNILEKDCIYFGDVWIGDLYPFKSRIDWRLKYGNTLHHQSLLIPKSLFLKSPFDERFKIFADFDFNQRLFKSKRKFIACSQVKAFALPGGISDDSTDLEWLAIIYKNYGAGFAVLGYLHFVYQKINKVYLVTKNRKNKPH